MRQVNLTLRAAREWRTFSMLAAVIVLAPSAYGVFAQFGFWPGVGFVCGLVLLCVTSYYQAKLYVMVELSSEEVLSRAAAESVVRITKMAVAEMELIADSAGAEILGEVRRIAEETTNRGGR